jgi:hypothetical protein
MNLCVEYVRVFLALVFVLQFILRWAPPLRLSSVGWMYALENDMERSYQEATRNAFESEPT